MQLLHNRLHTEHIGHVTDVHGKHDSNVVDMRPGMGVKMEMTRTDSVRVVHLLVIHTEPVELHRHEAKPYTNPSENDPYIPFPS